MLSAIIVIMVFGLLCLLSSLASPVMSATDATARQGFGDSLQVYAQALPFNALTIGLNVAIGLMFFEHLAAQTYPGSAIEQAEIAALIIVPTFVALIASLMTFRAGSAPNHTAKLKQTAEVFSSTLFFLNLPVAAVAGFSMLI